ncbi:hypothetical protein V3C99_005958 [Haemonchus contortus]|uniref:Transposase n=1 Tax=Haemonchus contortus TaxID=6289 RepID=A0A7I4XTL9_HAECO|nr:Hypothetical protein CBG19457 [Haemonchus contortus]
MVSLDDRSAVVAVYKRGSSLSEIDKMLKLHREQVHRVIKRFEESGKIENRPRGRPERTTRTSSFQKAVKDKLRRDSERSMRKLAKEHNVSNSTMQRLVKEDIGLYPYKIAKGHCLTKEMKASRLEKCKKMKKTLARGENLGRILFTGEKIFTVEPFRNPQKQRILLPKGWPREVMVERSRFPRSVMVWAGISSLGKTKLVFVEKGVKINAEIYRKQILEDAAIPWAESNAKNVNWTFQQDWAPADSAKKTLQWCETMLPDFWTKEVRPSNSPDLNPMDFAVWSILEQKACAIEHRSLESLKKALLEAWNEISPEMIVRILRNFRKRLDACIKAKGGHFEFEM